MARVKTKDSFSHKLLRAVALSGAVVVAASTPYFGIMAVSAFKQELGRKRWREFYQTVYNLNKKKRLNVTQNPDGTFTLEITQIGQSVLEKYDIDNLKIEKPEEWDGGWRIISFDIPKHKKTARAVLLGKLKELGFIMMQKSVWAHPFECRKELAVIAKAFEVEPYVYSFEAWGFDNDKGYRLKRNFELKTGVALK